ncbi:aldehyde dehydrogenase [Nocardioides sp. cx-173]|uniref:aldehyde dehydrogenase family protein n=1 Tax=Nocardioides sp. cx-173 TaxID=2898796 RepID=UPI001E31E84C|nr:aldehyde dehydrogenase family protein [Nocardioides sp. cx-173]MCD4524398.1 aldehyde dehydrogenase family protein [Nocardioides sp. cx-173]UGB43114.1 aldehyde dehydrogenase family protein [Nocardioides sp. cx-173]
MTTTSYDAGAVRLELPEVSQLVAGRWSVPSERLDLVLEDPFLGTQLGSAVATGAEDVERAGAAAAAAYQSGAWVRMSPGARADVLDAIATELEEEVPRLAALEAFATGVPVSQTSIVGVIVPGAFRLAAQMLRGGALLEVLDGPAGHPVEVHRLPLGPALCLVPWNAPAPMAAHKVASSLAAGCPTILKPSEFAPYATTEMARVVSRVLADAGLDSGADVGTFQLVQGGPAVGGALVRDPRVRAVSFTGGLEGGRAIATACAPDFTATQLELGGNNALIVLPDADPTDAARAAVDLLTTLNGQWCRALGRLILPADSADEILRLALERLAGLRTGDPLDPATELGPVVHSAHLARLRAAIADRVALGGTAAATTPLPDGGHFLAPTLLTGVASEDALHEVFGPVATVHVYRDVDGDDGAVALANATPYGLEGYVVGADTERALNVARRVRAGEVKVNGSTIMSLHLMTPRPAWGLSGLGEEGTLETIRVFTGARVVGLEGGFALHSR